MGRGVIVWEKIFLAKYLYNRLCSVPDIRIYRTAPSEHVFWAALCSFNVENIHPTYLATFLDQQQEMAIQSGYHLGVSASARANLHSYNTVEDIDDFIQALNDTISFFNSFK
ncbi:hypothetical protein GBA52_024752 [Prunus armeniaca]|nr:hypothetical protein GBA52_024752 [Prunus armeniaca]